jgi:hypothetical protein
MQIQEDACTWSMPMLRVSRSSGVGADGIVLVEPNGREEFLAGSDTSIIWKIADTTRRVSVDVSLNSGATWTTLSDSATGTQQRWSVPRVESDRCIARVRMQASREADSTLLIPFDVSAVDITEVGSLALGTVHGYLMRTSSMYAAQTLVKAHTDTITDVVVDHRRTQYMLSGSVDGRVQTPTNS